MGVLTRLEQLVLDSDALEGRIGEVFGWRLAARIGGWALLARRDAWAEASSVAVDVVPWHSADDAQPSDVVVVHLQKGRDATREGVWRGWSVLGRGGRLILSGGNELGIKTAVRRLEDELGQPSEVVASGGRGRAVAFVKDGVTAGPAPPAIRRFEVDGLHFETPPGVFSAGELDPGSALLLKYLDTLEPVSSVFDPGCGCGVLGLVALRRWPGARAILADVDARAVAAAATNAGAAGMTSRVDCVWWDARTDPAPVSGRCDLAVVNPPFHGDGTAVDLTPARAVFAAVGQVLAPAGRALVVANRTLPWERDLAALGTIRLVRQTGRFKLIEIIRA